MKRMFVPPSSALRGLRRTSLTAIAAAIAALCATQAAWAAPSPSRIGSDGYFYLYCSTLNPNGVKTIMKGIEEERNVLTNAQVDKLADTLNASGINLIVLYASKQQTAYFYQQMQNHNIWIAQHFGTVKKELIPLPGTGGVIGTTPDPAWFKRNADSIKTIVNRLKGYSNILFWWMGGEFVEPIFNTPYDISGARAVVRAYIGYLRDTLAKYDNTYATKRPFNVSHHFLEIKTDGSYFNYSNLTDFTWFTTATHMHKCDVGLTPAWDPLFSIGEYADFPAEAGITTALNNGVAVNGGKPIFMGGWCGNAPLNGECKLADQGYCMAQKWLKIYNVLYNGYSTYHLDQWNGNNIPHRMMEWNGSSWTWTPAGQTLRKITTGTFDYTVGDGLYATYYDNKDFTGTTKTRIDQTVNFDWGFGSPDPVIGSDTWSARWTGKVQPRYSQTYTFYTWSDDGIRLWVNGTQIINNWTNHLPVENSGTITLTAGEKYSITLEYYEYDWTAQAKLSWSSATQPKEIIPRSQLFSNGGKAAAGDEITVNEPLPPTAVQLMPVRPNPVRESAEIKYQVSSPGNINLNIYNVSGQLVKTLVSETKPAGHHSVWWDGKDANGRKVAAGVYLYRLDAGSYSSVRKLTVLR